MLQKFDFACQSTRKINSIRTSTNSILLSLIKILILFLSINRTESVLGVANDPKFTVGCKSLFAQQLTTYPDTRFYTMLFSTVLPAPTTYYDVVISINTIHFLQSNTIGWNFTKYNISTTGFVLKYQAGLNSILYELAVNYFAIDNAYQDIQIVYFDYKCALLNQSTGYRSQNISYTIKKFANDSNYQIAVVIESFNLTNPQNDWMILRKTYYQYNLTVICQWYVYGLYKLHDIQFYMIFNNKAEQLVTYDRVAIILQHGVVNPSTNLTVIQNSYNVNFKQRDRFFSGLKGFSMTKIGRKRFQFTFNNTLDFTFTITNTDGGQMSYVDYSTFAIYRYTCSAGQVYVGNEVCGLSCNPGTYPDYSYGLDVCKSCHYSCLTCYDPSQTSCATCHSSRDQIFITTVGTNSYYKCVCKSTYFQRLVTACALCSSYISGCSTCLDNTTCTSCGSPTLTKLFEGKCYCPNPNDTYLGSSCVPRIIGCQTHVWDGSKYICTQCYVQRNFTITTNFNCTCQNNARQDPIDVNTNGQYWCKYQCGDSYLSVDEQCDDGNLINNDGCSDICTIELNFTCTQVLTQISVCKYNLSTQLIFQSSQRVLYKNTAVLNFTLQPYIPYMDQIANMSSIVVTNMPVTKIQHIFFCPFEQQLRCNLTLTVQYTDHMQLSLLSLQLRLSDHPKIKYDSRLLFFIPQGNVAQISYEKESTLRLLQTFQIIVLVLVIMSLVLFLSSIYVQKMIGIQLIMSVQYIYYIMTPIQSNPVEVVPLQRNLRYSNGFNRIQNYTYYRYQPLPNQLNHQFYQKQFLMNMNVMLCGLLLAMFLLIFVKLIKVCQDHCNKTQSDNKIFDEEDNVTKKKFDNFYVFYWNNIFFIYVFFVMYQVLFNSVITTILQNPTETFFSASFNFFAAFISFFIIIIGILSVGYWYYQGNKKKGRIALQQTQIIPYKFQLCKKQYILAYAVINPIKIWIVAIFYSQTACFYLILSVCFIYFIFLIVLRPYQQPQDLDKEQDQQQRGKVCFSIHNFGICFNQFCLISFALLCLIWNIVIDTYDFDNFYPDFILYVGVTFIILLNIVAFLRIFYKKIGALLFCQSFKSGNSGGLHAQNAFNNMRKIVRDTDLKGLDDTDLQADDIDDKNDDKNISKKDKLKILQDIRKAKNNYVNWQDDKKPKFTTDQSASQKNDENQYQEGANGKRIRKKRRPGLVEMETLTKGLKQSQYIIGKSHDKKYAELNKSIIDSLMDKKYVQNASHYIPKNIYDQQGQQQQKKKTQNSQLNDVKQRLRRDYQQKRGKKQKTQLKSFIPQ